MSFLQLQACERLSALVRVWFLGPFLPDDRGKMKLGSLADFVSQVQRASSEQVVKPPAALSVQPFCAARAQFMKEPLHFDPVPFLDLFEASAYLEPRLLRRFPPEHTDAPRARLRRDEELLKVVQVWGKADKFVVARRDEAKGAFATPTDPPTWYKTLSTIHQMNSKKCKI